MTDSLESGLRLSVSTPQGLNLQGAAATAPLVLNSRFTYHPFCGGSGDAGEQIGEVTTLQVLFFNNHLPKGRHIQRILSFTTTAFPALRCWSLSCEGWVTSWTWLSVYHSTTLKDHSLSTRYTGQFRIPKFQNLMFLDCVRNLEKPARTFTDTEKKHTNSTQRGPRPQKPTHNL